MTGYLLVSLLSALLLGVIIELVRRERLTFKYAAGWLLLAVLGFLFSRDDRFLRWAAERLGFELLSNFVFFSVLCGFVFLSLYLTILLCQQNERNDRIAQRLGLMENILQQIRSAQQSRPSSNQPYDKNDLKDKD